MTVHLLAADTESRKDLGPRYEPYLNMKPDDCADELMVAFCHAAAKLLPNTATPQYKS